MSLDGIVFLHGWTMCGSVFDDLIQQLDLDVPCFAPDLPGHGARAAEDPSLETATQTVDALLRAQGLDNVLLVGWSMGAAIAWRYIQHFGQDRLAGLMTVDMSPRLANAPDWPHGLIGQDAASLAKTSARMQDDWHRTAQSIAANMSVSPKGPQGLPSEQALAQVLSNDPAAMRRLWNDLVAMDQRDTIGQIAVPYLVSYGAQSQVYPSSAAQWLCATAQNARGVAFQRSGHSPHLEEPDAFAQALRGFAKMLSAPPPTK